MRQTNPIRILTAIFSFSQIYVCNPKFSLWVAPCSVTETAIGQQNGLMALLLLWMYILQRSHDWQYLPTFSYSLRAPNFSFCHENGQNMPVSVKLYVPLLVTVCTFFTFKSFFRWQKKKKKHIKALAEQASLEFFGVFQTSGMKRLTCAPLSSSRLIPIST